MSRTLQIKTSDSAVNVHVPEKHFRSLANDSGAMAFFIGQLTGLQAQVYETIYPEIFYHELVPVNTDFPRGITDVAYRSYNAVTMAKFIGASADDLPRVALDAKISKVPVEYGGNVASWNLNELESSRLLGIPLDGLLLKEAFRGYQEFAQRVAFFGDKTRDMFGLLDHPNVPVTASTLNWATNTDNQLIVDELDKAVKQVWEQTKGAFCPDVLLIPAEKFTKISSQRMEPGTDTSILNWYRENNFARSIGRELEIRPVFQLNAAEMVKNGVADSKGRIVAYTRDTRCVELFQPLPWESLPPQFDMLEVKVASHFKTSGTEFKQPLSGCYVDLI